MGKKLTQQVYCPDTEGLWIISARAGKLVKISNFIAWFCLKDKLHEQKTDTAVYCPDTEGLWKVLAQSESWQGGLSLLCLYSSRGKERGVRGVIMPAFSCYKNICKL